MKQVILTLLFIICLQLTALANTPILASENVWQLVKGMPSNTSVEKIQQMLIDNFDFNHFCELALYKHWPNWTVEQKETFKQKFSAKLVQRVKTNLSSNKRHELTTNFDLRKSDNILAEVVGSGIYKNRKVDMEIFLVNSDGAWKVYDYNIEGANMIRNYRAQFNKLLRLYGFEGFIKKISA